ncbi:unnamed protein product [Prorocentrum cordatum]|uniref:Uncharacterized protein n=1 Tax=Prorocentrum cordatum TaxID=2364126 RepID=A0ABN9RLG2_9DINO|nr:unnamed protein product [Polarella glacialis]
MEMSYGAQAATEEDPKAKIQGKRFEALEALRALAALGITVFHYGCCFARLDYFIDVQKMSLHLLVDFFMDGSLVDLCFLTATCSRRRPVIR